MKDWATISQRLVMIGQLGLSLLMPLLLCLGAFYLLGALLLMPAQLWFFKKDWIGNEKA